MHDDNLLISTLAGASAGREAEPFALPATGGEPRAFGVLWSGAARTAAALIAAGVAPGDRVAAQVEKSLEAVELYLGTVMAGGVYLPLNTGYTPSELDYFLGDAEPAVFVCDPARRAALEPVARDTAVLTLGAGGAGSLTDAAADTTPLEAAVARGPEDLAAILYTSGTTGRSKGAMLTHRNLASNAETLASVWRFTAADVLIHALPIFHTHGLFVATNVALVAGARLIFHAKFDAEAVLADFPRATALMGVPTFYTRLLDLPGLDRDACAGIRLFVSGSAPLLAETHRQWHARTGHAILERYGMTETSMNTSNPYEGDRRPGTVGFPLPGVELRIADAEGAPLPAGETGGIEVRGPNVCAGYWRKPDKTAAEFRESGWFITGDVGTIDPDGYFSIVGRSKDLIISGGYNIYPKEIELLIDAVEGVAESAVFGAPHPDFGEGVAAAVVRAPGSTVSAEAVLAEVAPKLARFKQPRHLVFLDALPRNAMGKVQKAQLRDAHRDVFAAAGAGTAAP